jgi:hypothetical protein
MAEHEMTIRERLNQNKRRLATVFCMNLVIFLVGCILSAWFQTLGIAIGCVSFAAAILILLYGQASNAFTCPRCGGSLVILVFQMNSNPLKMYGRIRYCPFCGVDIDAKESATPTRDVAEILI